MRLWKGFERVKVYTNIQNFVLTIIFLAYGVLDIFGMFDSIEFLKNKSDSLMLIAMSIFLFTHLIERNISINRIETSTDKMLDMVSEIASKENIDIIRLGTSEELYNYLAQAVRHAKKSVYDLTWGMTTPIIGTAVQKQALSNYFSALLETIKKTDIVYKEVMTFPDKRRLYRVKRILEEGYNGYLLRYYKITPEEHKVIPPLLQFMVVDDNEVILHMHRGTVLEPSGQQYIAIRNRDIVNYFIDYYNAIWSGGEPLIDVTYSDVETIDNLVQNFDREDEVFKQIYNRE